MAFSPGDWLRAVATLHSLWELEKKHGALIEALSKEIQALKDRVTRLEAREEVLIAEAKGAAAAAATQHIASLARDIGAIDERTRRLGSDHKG
jgi:hypothetical protein